MRLRRTAFVALFLLALPAWAAPTPAGGRFTIFAGGREAGSEIITVTRGDETRTIESRGTLHRDDRTQEIRLTMVVETKTGRLRSVVARGTQRDVRRDVTLALSGGRLVGELREAESARSIDLESRAGEVVIAEPFSAPYLELLTRYDLDRGGPQSFPAVYPLRGETGTVTLALLSEQALELDGKGVLARRVTVTPDRGNSANLWIDEEGQMLVCARSVAGISAVRGRALSIGLKPGEDPPDPPEVLSMRLRFSAGGQTLAATFTKPRRAEGQLPAVLLLAGSGPQDRNGNVPGAELQWNCLHTLAVALARQGIATLRYDERGVARSGGSFHDAGLTDFVEDARAALTFLRSREDIDVKRLGLIGHSEGALIGAMVAGKKGAVAALVTIGAPADPLDVILLAQVAARLERRETPRREAQRILGGMRAFFEHVRLSTADVVSWEGRSREVRWLREHMETDPVAVYSGVAARTLVVHGERDVQVPATHAARVEEMLPEARRAGRRVLPGLDHFLIPTSGGVANYGDPDRRMAEDAVASVVGWIVSILR